MRSFPSSSNIAYIETQFSSVIKVLPSDSGGEYMSTVFHDFLKNKGILSQHSCPHTPQQNGVAEWKNHHLLEVTRTLLLESSVLSRFWVEALSTAVYLINRLSSQTLNLESPYFRLYQQTPHYGHLHTFGYICFVHLPSHEPHKLSAQSIKCAFMGYSTNHKGFVCYGSSSKRLRVSRNVVFLKSKYFFPTCDQLSSDAIVLLSFDSPSSSPNHSKPTLVYAHQSTAPPLPNPDLPYDPEPLALRHSSRVSRPPD